MSLYPHTLRRSISIHSLRVEGDGAKLEVLSKYSTISIHSLRVEGDLCYVQYRRNATAFQSTPSVWRETDDLRERIDERHISIHSLRVEGDHTRKHGHFKRHNFNPLPPCGGRLSHHRHLLLQHLISIHSLRVEGDLPTIALCPILSISIHSLRVEGDPVDAAIWLIAWLFQSTPSVWRETTVQSAERNIITISIHSLRVEGDRFVYNQQSKLCNFNPLPPCGGRL